MADATTVAPHVYTAVLENDKVRVLEIRMKPGEKTEMHSHPAAVGIMVQGGKARFTHPDGSVLDMDASAAEPTLQPAVEHSTENIGDTELHGFIVELK
jgi:oxalate decarboxylase/phosphoglucose isomerase-like protein (cupin superfamily)